MASRDMKRGNRSHAHSPKLSSLLRLSLPPIFHRNEPPKQSHSTRHCQSHHGQDRDRQQTSNRVKSRSRHRSRDEAQVTLSDLDGRQGSFSVAIQRGIDVVRLETCIKHKYQDCGRPLVDADRVRFFANAKELGPGDLADCHSSVWYRVVSLQDNDTWKFTYVGRDTDDRLGTSPTVADDMVRCIEAGNTLGQLRKLIANHMDVDDPNRITIKAADGVRKGSLQGDMWELRQVRSWHCRRLSIHVSPPKAYVILERPWGQYLIHPQDRDTANGVFARDVKKWMEAGLLNNVDRLHNSKLRLKSSHITLLSGGTRLSNRSVIVAGGKYQFELPWYLEDPLAIEESWLLPATETCTVCTDEKKATELPVRIARGCKHKPTTCRECLGHWIRSSLDTSTWNRLRCPECSELLSFEGVRRYAFKEDFDRYDTLATRAALRLIPNLRWCLSTSCESGQIHDPACRKFKCIACKAKHCAHHEVPWHSGETCEEYDHRNKRRRKDDKASAEMIKRTSKVCPECKKAVHKFTGCNHITCECISGQIRLPPLTMFPWNVLTDPRPGVCGHEWCYICFAPFRRNQHDFLYCRHNAGCTEVDPFADIIGPDGQPRVPDRVPNERDELRRFGVFGAPEVMIPPHHDHQHDPRLLRRWINEMEAELRPPRVNHDDRRAPTGRPVLNDPLEENIDPGGREVNRNTGRHGDQRQQHDLDNAFARAWMAMDDVPRGPAGAVVGDMARNRHMLFHHNFARQFDEMDDLEGHIRQEFGLFRRRM